MVERRSDRVDAQGGPAEENPETDPDDPTDEDREAQLIDERVAELERQPQPLPRPPRESWRRRTATGAILTGLALGLQEALETRREEPSIMMETSGEPPTDLPVEADVGSIRPADNVVTIRPWLLGGDTEEAGAEEGNEAGRDGAEHAGAGYADEGNEAADHPSAGEA